MEKNVTTLFINYKYIYIFIIIKKRLPKTTTDEPWDILYFDF